MNNKLKKFGKKTYYNVTPSDRNLKENIKFIDREEINKVKNVFAKSFNYKDDNLKNKLYGVIAQEVIDAGLGEVVHTKDDGTLGVDYTSLLMLKIAYLEDFCAMLNGKVSELESKLNLIKKFDFNAETGEITEA